MRELSFFLIYLLDFWCCCFLVQLKDTHIWIPFCLFWNVNEVDITSAQEISIIPLIYFLKFACFDLNDLCAIYERYDNGIYNKESSNVFIFYAFVMSLLLNFLITIFLKHISYMSEKTVRRDLYYFLYMHIKKLSL